MGDLIDQIKFGDDNFKEVKAKRRPKFRKTKIFLPRVLHIQGKSWRPIIYESDILQEIKFNKLSYRKKDQFSLKEIKALEVETIKVDILDESKQFELGYSRDKKEKLTIIDIDFSYMVKRISNFIPNPFEAARIFRRNS